MSTSLHADTATYAGIGTGLFRSRTLVLIAAVHIDAHPAGALRTKLDESLRAGLHALAAGDALGLVHHRQPGLGIHAQRAELASGDAIPATETAESAARVAGVKRSLHAAAERSVINIHLGAYGAAAIATHHGHLGSLGLNLVTENVRDLLHHVVAAHGAEMSAEVAGLHGGIGESMAAGIAATAAVRSRQGLLYLLDAGIFLNLELLGDEEEDHCKHETQPRQNHDSPDNN